MVKVPFDLAHWQKVAAEKYPNGLPKPHSDDPTQWLFNGHPKGSEQPLQVAVARLLGYRWPRQTGSEFPDCPALGPDGLEDLADADGIVCLPPINKEQPAAARLRNLLAAAFGADWSPSRERDLLAATGAKQTNLEDWLRDDFFEQHCKLFQNRPFIWHIWDGRKDGFHALVNYHRLDHATLQKLTYSYLGDWIRQQDADAKADKPGAAERLGAAQALQAELIKILEGEPPYDLFVRWKPLAGAAHRLAAGPQRRRAPQHPPLPARPGRRQEGRRHPPRQAQHQVGQGPRQGAPPRQGRLPLVLARRRAAPLLPRRPRLHRQPLEQRPPHPGPQARGP